MRAHWLKLLSKSCRKNIFAAISFSPNWPQIQLLAISCSPFQIIAFLASPLQLPLKPRGDEFSPGPLTTEGGKLEKWKM